jgi:hypothetical protein
VLESLERYFSARPLLVLFLLIDIGFIVIHILLWWHGQFPDRLNLERDGSLPEMFNYLKWTICAAACCVAFARKQAPLYLAWALLFVYFLFDDSRSLHETMGHVLVAKFGLKGAFGLRAQEFGELAAFALSGAGLFGLIVLAYRWSGAAGARSFTWLLAPWLGVLIVCGVGVDFLHSLVAHYYKGSVFSMLVGLVEEGGEMVPGSFLASICVREAFGLPQGVREAALPT